MPFRLILFFLSASLFCSGRGICAGAPDDSGACARPPALRQMEEDGLCALRAAGFVLTAPVRWDGSDWLRAAGTGGATAASSLLDNDVRSFMQRNQSRANDGINSVGEPYGLGLNMILLSAAGYLAGLAFDHAWIRETSLLAGTSILVAGTVSTIVKFSVGRGRPYLNEGHGRFRPFAFSSDDYVSFPSGHTIVAFAFSTVLAERIDNVWASMGLYGLAGATAFARMYSDEHWFSDVVFGAGVSIAVGKSVVRWYEGNQGSPDGRGLSITPTGNGIALIWIL
jgi:membrane-associated phospholipid phosphatase